MEIIARRNGMNKKNKKTCVTLYGYTIEKNTHRKNKKKFCVTFSGYVIEQKKHIQIIKQLNY